MVKQFVKLFAIQYGLTFCLYMNSLYEAPLHSPCSISIRQLDLMSKSWNELLSHLLQVRLLQVTEVRQVPKIKLLGIVAILLQVQCPANSVIALKDDVVHTANFKLKIDVDTLFVKGV